MKNQKKLTKKTKKIFKDYGDLTWYEARGYIIGRVEQHFTQWMHGQTAPIIKLPNGHEVPGVFFHDVERYVEGILYKKPTYFD